jgi:uncharacterized protein YeaO (DUF488 family)
MSVRVVRLGSPRQPGEGLRIGTVRRPPRGVPKADFARLDWYDVWYPELAPSAETMALAQEAFSVGCYCQDEQHCHRTLLRGLLADQGASTGQGA